jgi:hypothetical protein
MRRLLALLLSACATPPAETLHRTPEGAAVSEHEWIAAHGARRAVIRAASRDLACDEAKIVADFASESARWTAVGCGRRAEYAPSDDAMAGGRSHGAPVIIVTHRFVLVGREPAVGRERAVGREPAAP